MSVYGDLGTSNREPRGIRPSGLNALCSPGTFNLSTLELKLASRSRTAAAALLQVESGKKKGETRNIPTDGAETTGTEEEEEPTSKRRPSPDVQEGLTDLSLTTPSLRLITTCGVGVPDELPELAGPALSEDVTDAMLPPEDRVTTVTGPPWLGQWSFRARYALLWPAVTPFGGDWTNLFLPG